MYIIVGVVIMLISYILLEINALDDPPTNFCIALLAGSAWIFLIIGLIVILPFTLITKIIRAAKHT
jgi:vacuolar-type H+-ATPase subunit I/STV1